MDKENALENLMNVLQENQKILSSFRRGGITRNAISEILQSEQVVALQKRRG